MDQEMLDLPAEIFGLPRAAAGSWASCVRIIDPVQVDCSFVPFLPSHAVAVLND